MSAQLRLFIDEREALNARPQQYLKTIGSAQFQQRFQADPRSLIAFEKSENADDWRDLMRYYLVRRTRSHIVENYAETDHATGRFYIDLPHGERFYFPRRVPKTVRLGASAQFDRLYSDKVVELVNALSLPRYGLGQYVDGSEAEKATAGEKRQIENLSRAGKRLMGFCRTNLFKRLESSGASFLQSVDATSCAIPSFCMRWRTRLSCQLARWTPIIWTPTPKTRTAIQPLSPCAAMMTTRRQSQKRRRSTKVMWRAPAKPTICSAGRIGGDSSGCARRSSARTWSGDCKKTLIA